MKIVKILSSAVFGIGITVACVFTAPALSQDQDLGKASDVVRLLFAKHSARFKSGDDPLMNQAGLITRFFVDCLAVDGLQGKLGFDPVYGAQDAEISDLKVYPDPEMPIFRGAAQIRLEFRNFGAPRSFVYTLIKASNGEWQISDIYSEDDAWSLTELMRNGGIPAIACDPATEITLFDAPAKSEAGNTESGMEDGDLPAHMNEEASLSGAEGADPDANVGMEQGDTPAYTGGSGSDLLLLLDGSGSMWGQVDGVAKITTAKQALTGLISDLSGKTNVGLIAYGHRREGDCNDIETLLPVANHAPAAIEAAIGGISPRGKTPIARTLEAVARAFPDADRQANVLLISDGLETCGGDPCAAARALAEQGIKTRVHVVGFDLSDEENRALQCIAKEGNGNYYTANNAQEFVEAVNDAVKATEEETKPAAPPAPSRYFVETFDGDDIDASWSVVDGNENLRALDGEAMFVAATGKNNYYDSEKAINRFVLDKPLPDGDFDLVLDVRMALQTGREHIWLSVMDDLNNQIGVLLWADWKGCGPGIRFSLMKLSGSAGEKPEKTAFEQALFDGPMLDNLCSKAPRAYADEILKSLFETGATIRLMRRGRKVTGELEMALPAFGDREARSFTYTSEPITALRLSGQPSIFAGQWHKAAPGESHFYFDEFAIESLSQ